MNGSRMPSFSNQYEEASHIVLEEIGEALGKIDLEGLERLKEDIIRSNRVFL